MTFKEYFYNILLKYYENKQKIVRPATMNTYLGRFSAIYKMFDMFDKYKEAPTFLYDVEDVIKKLNVKYKENLSSLTTSISAILILLQALKISDNVIIKYREFLFEKQKTKMKIKKEKLNLESDLKINKKKILFLKKEFEKNILNIDFENISLDDKMFLQKYIIFYLYGDKQAPVRLNYHNMLKVNKEVECVDNDYNYKTKHYFIFKNYKTVRLYNTVKIKINLDLKKKINKYISYTGDDKYLFVNLRSGRPFTAHQFGKLIIETFGVGCTTMRRYYASCEFQKLFKINAKLLETSRKMMNSPEVLKSNYLQLLKEMDDKKS